MADMQKRGRLARILEAELRRQSNEEPERPWVTPLANLEAFNIDGKVNLLKCVDAVLLEASRNG